MKIECIGDSNRSYLVNSAVFIAYSNVIQKIHNLWRIIQ